MINFFLYISVAIKIQSRDRINIKSEMQVLKSTH